MFVDAKIKSPNFEGVFSRFLFLRGAEISAVVKNDTLVLCLGDSATF